MQGQIAGYSPLAMIAFGIGDVLRAAEIAPVESIGVEGEDLFALCSETQIGGNDGEGAFFGQVGEDAGRNDVNAGEGERVDGLRGNGPLGLRFADRCGGRRAGHAH